MGVNAVVIVENSRNVSLEDFISGLRQDLWGQRAVDRYNGWEEFNWEGKNYFSWLSGPRVGQIELYDEGDSAPFEDNPVQLTFLKVMLVVERLAGGPVYVGNDAVNRHLPEEVYTDDEAFFLPAMLDGLIPKWREVANMQVEKPRLVF